MGQKYSNNAVSTLVAGITNVATSLSVAAGQGALFPALGAGDYFYATLANAAGSVEIVKVTARSTDTMTIVRGQDSTSAAAWNSGDKVELRLVAAILADMPKLDEANTFTNAQNEAQGADIASASTVNLTTATGNYVNVTGTTAITAITLAQGAERTVKFAGALTLTNGASLLLPSGANITTAAGDVAKFRGEAAGIVRCVSYQRADGSAVALVSPTKLSTGAPSWDSSGNLSFNSGYGSVATAYGCRAWAQFGGSTGTRNGSGNVSSVTRNTTGDYTVNFASAMPDAYYAAAGLSQPSSNANCWLCGDPNTTAPSTTAYRFKVAQGNMTNYDATSVSIAFFR